MVDEPTPLAPTGVEVWFAVAAAVAVVFAGFAVWKLVRREWSVGFALTLVLLTFVVPFAGPVILLARWCSTLAPAWVAASRGRHVRRAGGT